MNPRIITLFDLSLIIARHLAGEMTDEEREQLNAWLAESAHHRELLERVRDERLTREKLLAYERADVEEALARFLAEKRKRSMRRRLTRYAGVAALPVIAAAWWLSSRPVAEAPAVDEPLLPRLASSITLTAPGGKYIELPAALPPEQRIGADLVLKQEAGMARIVPVTGDREEYRTISVPRGGEFRIMLGDGTKVWVNAETKFSFPLEFAGGERRVMLEGEAYFEVARDSGRAFAVETPLATVTVRGTSFNLSSDARRARTVATLVEGAVDFTVRETGEQVPMRAGEQVVLTGEGWDKREVEPSLYTSWREGWLNFSSERLEEMLEVIARWYNAEVLFVNEAAKDMLYTGQVRKYEDFREVLNIISLTRSARFSVDNRTIIVH
ncbi:MAG: FecR domain-containing protein [Odoribacteraceae bacterium]|jgi:ferric-dicitrate binding protein FerR (iron transport regulator)|nr:FecR domain-containing protein [Odoribacteraceae bacterium]